ncbi:hypothetical protein Patl1_25087 [Pistacia atlantica]|uniref:Uncharacterized protein n=1 Tax=Pistacia atlantica TaxID=434234 RepID=A0ACC1B2A0_9ROSI|nr:hypothetical protein Patl1_25087 [Pistacia atlantica]
MAYRPLELNIISAKHLKDVNLISKMDLYVVASLVGDYSKKKQKAKSRVDHDCGPNPTWNFPVKFTIDESLAQQNRLSLDLKIRCDGILGDKDVGEVNVRVKDLLDAPGDLKNFKSQTYQVMTPSGKPKGELTFSYKFGDIIPAPAAGAAAAMPMNAGGVYGSYGNGKVKADEPVMAYPAAVGSSSTPYGVHAHAPYPPPPQQGYAYPPPPAKATANGTGGYPPPPPPQGYGYPPPHPQGYGYPPPPPPAYGYPGQPGYGYPPVQQPPKKNKLGAGAGLGAGLIGGMLGGLLLGDIVSDAGDGFDGGFDF